MSERPRLTCQEDVLVMGTVVGSCVGAVVPVTGSAPHIIHGYPFAALHRSVSQTVSISHSRGESHISANGVSSIHIEAIITNCAVLEGEETFCSSSDSMPSTVDELEAGSLTGQQDVLSVYTVVVGR